MTDALPDWSDLEGYAVLCRPLAGKPTHYLDRRPDHALRVATWLAKDPELQTSVWRVHTTYVVCIWSSVPFALDRYRGVRIDRKHFSLLKEGW